MNRPVNARLQILPSPFGRGAEGEGRTAACNAKTVGWDVSPTKRFQPCESRHSKRSEESERLLSRRSFAALRMTRGHCLAEVLPSSCPSFQSCLSCQSCPLKPRTRRARPALALVGLLLALTVLGGCDEELQTEYGRRRGPGSDRSVNGTAVLAELFEQAGHDVSGAHRLEPRLADQADCIVWFPDDRRPPLPAVRDWRDGWLAARAGRTLIYVGRDFDAAAWYWERIAPEAPPEQQETIRRRAEAIRESMDVLRGQLPDSDDCDWFTLEPNHPTRRVRTLSGEADWTAGVDPTRLDVELNSRLVPPAFADVLLASDGDALVSRQTYGWGQRIVVANGSFLLNLPLVNHEHRKLAAKLIDAIGPPSQNVVFLESGRAGPPIGEEPLSGGSDGLAVFHVWPTNWILAHLVVVGVLFCAWRWPIFGTPREPEPEGRSDFGRHLDALARLLRATNDTAYAEARLDYYRRGAKPNE